MNLSLYNSAICWSHLQQYTCNHRRRHSTHQLGKRCPKPIIKPLPTSSFRDEVVCCCSAVLAPAVLLVCFGDLKRKGYITRHLTSTETKISRIRSPLLKKQKAKLQWCFWIQRESDQHSVSCCFLLIENT